MNSIYSWLLNNSKLVGFTLIAKLIAKLFLMTIHGTKYKVGAALHIDYSTEELPLFWEVEKIVVLNKHVTQKN